VIGDPLTPVSEYVHCVDCGYHLFWKCACGHENEHYGDGRDRAFDETWLRHYEVIDTCRKCRKQTILDVDGSKCP
jgi:hypothetical protein